MKLSRLIEVIGDCDVFNFTEKEIESVTSESRERLKNSIFVAVKGLSGDGADYAADAVINGATAVIFETEIKNRIDGVTYIKVPDSRTIQSKVASVVYDSPSDKIDLTAVTGTNGKTSFAYIYRHILKSCGKKCGMIGTVEYDLGKRYFIPERTTPDAVFLQRYLNEMVNSGLDYAVVEVSSHSLTLKRVLETYFDTAVFTNLSEEHLDFHEDMNEYAAVKSELFRSYMKKDGVSLINLDDPYSEMFVSASSKKVKTYSSKNKNSDLFISSIKMTDDGLVTDYIYSDEIFTVKTNLSGYFQAYNIAASILSAFEKGITVSQVVSAMKKPVVIPGRMETIYKKSFEVVIDYAHTPDALKNTIESIKSYKKGKLITVFGCGGNRDQNKRPLMGKIAVELSDKVIITTDNPRYEDPKSITDSIVAGLNTKKIIIENDRRKAINEAVSTAEKGDVILIAGKGHECCQEINGVKYPFSDKDEVLKITGSLEA